MKEEIQIEQGARLADTKAPENLSTQRARAFVASRLAEESGAAQGNFISRFFNGRPALAWGGSAFAFAVAAAIALAVILPHGNQPIHSGGVFEMESIHASSQVADTTLVEAADSLQPAQLPVAE